MLNIKLLNPYEPIRTIVFSDASDLAAGAYVVNCMDSVYHSNWDEEDRTKSSTYREIKAVWLALRAYGSLLRHKSVKWFSDSQSCVQIVKAGSTKKELQGYSIKIFQICLEKNIDLKIEWVPRSKNEIADNISKLHDTDDWEVSNDFFQHIDSLWGPHTIDRFASYQNRKVFRYNSKCYDFEVEAVDAFTEHWGDTNSWLVPPISLVPKTIFHILACSANGTIIVPKWPSAGFWPILFDAKYKPKRFVKEVLEFSSNQDIFRHRN